MNTDNTATIEPMPPALLALLFSKGVVAIPAEQRPAAPQETAPPARPRLAAGTQPVPEVAFPPAQPAPALATAAPTEANIPLPYLGSFGQQVLIIVSDSTALHINEEALALLTKILAAVRLSMADVAIVNAARHTIAYQALAAQLPPKVCLLFGIDAADLGVPLLFPTFQVQRWSGVQFLQAPGLELMVAGDAKAVQFKKQLWDALRKIFEV